MESVLSQPGMEWMLIMIAVIDVLSIAATALISIMFYNARRRQITFLRSLGHGNADASVHELWTFPPLLWIYILLSAGVTVATTALFVFQPHLL